MVEPKRITFNFSNMGPQQYGASNRTRHFLLRFFSLINVLLGKAKAFVRVRLIEADDLPKTDSSTGAIDAYCCVNISKELPTYKTKVILRNTRPLWNESFGLLAFEMDQVIEIALFDQNVIKSDEHVGTIKIPIAELEPGKNFDKYECFVFLQRQMVC